jgi:hypothetical protein
VPDSEITMSESSVHTPSRGSGVKESRLQESTETMPAPAMMLIEPAAEIEELRKHWQKIQELKKSILDKTDIAEIQGRTFVKRSGWRKMASAFAISDRILSKQLEDLGNGDFLWRIEVEAYHLKSGRSMTGVAVCSSTERKFAHPEHDVFAICFTRAANRAISDLIGLGEVSAEEIEAEQPMSQSQHIPAVPPSSPQVQKEEICVCGHARPIHLFDGKALYCMQCTREGKNIKCNLPPGR